MTESWWRYGFHVAMQLSRIAKPQEWFEKKKPYWQVEGFKFLLTELDVMRNGDEIEEQLWAIKQGRA